MLSAGSTEPSRLSRLPQCGGTGRRVGEGSSGSTQPLGKLHRSHHPPARAHSVALGTRHALAVAACPPGCWHGLGLVPCWRRSLVSLPRLALPKLWLPLGDGVYSSPPPPCPGTWPGRDPAPCGCSGEAVQCGVSPPGQGRVLRAPCPAVGAGGGFCRASHGCLCWGCNVLCTEAGGPPGLHLGGAPAQLWKPRCQPRVLQ